MSERSMARRQQNQILHKLRGGHLGQRKVVNNAAFFHGKENAMTIKF